MNQRHTQKQHAAGVMQSPFNIEIAKSASQTVQIVDTAIQHKQTLLAYQPVMMSCGLRQVGFYEGLISVMDATDHIIPAKNFIQVIKDTELRLSINMSARSIRFGPWNRNFYRWLERDETISERLSVEITESSALSEPHKVVKFMDELQRLGVKLCP
jgi:EAL domain-containing protein (putative c-di-GMP-specific phosphodiesterase class I)